MNLSSFNYFRYRDSMRGFTLIELMVAMMLSLFLIGGAILMYISTRASYLDSNQLSRMQENIRFSSDYMVRDIRNAGFRDEQTLTFNDQEAVQQKVAEVRNDGAELIIRYAGRGHCQQDFDSYRVVENRYFLDASTGELRCAGGVKPNPYDPAVDPVFSEDSDGIALVDGVAGLNFRLAMANGTVRTGNFECEEVDSAIAANERCLGVKIGIELEALSDSDNAGQFEERFVELISTFRNTAINQIYASCTRLDRQAGEPGWC